MEIVKSDIEVHKINEVSLRIKTDSRIMGELRRWFRARPPGYRFMPLFRNRLWDGWTYFINKGILPTGLLNSLKEFADKGKYTLYNATNDIQDAEESDVRDFVTALELPFAIRDYQFNAIYNGFVKKRLNIEAPTGSGKSLMIYGLTRLMLYEEKPVLIIVPKTSLASQLYGDFIEYGWDDAYNSVTTIYGGRSKNFEMPVVISTWQTLIQEVKKKNFHIFERFGAIFCDESHNAKALSIMTIASKCINAEWRIGFSGTQPAIKTTDWFNSVGSLGPVESFVSYDALRKANHIAGVEITNLFLKYPYSICEYNYINNKSQYTDEIYYIYENPSRVKFIVTLVKALQNNTIVLFSKIDQGKRLFQELSKSSDKKILYIDGGVATADREHIRTIMEQNDNVVLVGSYSCIAEGMNVKNIHNIVAASSYKSKVKTLQSIGRGVRVKDGKTTVKIFDIIDDLSIDVNENGINKKYISYGMKHYKERKKIYESVGFDPPKNQRILLS